MILVVVESPGKIKKLEHILGAGYKVIASVGHIMDLDPKKMSIEIENNFNPIYIINADKTSVVKNLKEYAKISDDVLIASDEDREGETIAWCVAHVLGIKKPKRITFNSITKTELMKAVKSPRQIDNNMVNAQKARRILDRIVGYELSPLLDKHMGQKCLSAGRVQSVVARLIVDRENEIKKFFSGELESYFKFKGNFLSVDKSFNANLYDLEGVNNDGVFKGNTSKIENETGARKFIEKCMKSVFKVAHIFSKKRTQGPSPPFTTSTLQQEGSRKFGFSSKRTMTAAQHLYEAGYITYMRTDSVNLSEEALQNIKKYVIERYGDNYYRRLEYKSKSKNTQEAHEACRPTDVYTESVENNNGKIGNDEIRLYSLIWKRTVASQMKPAEYNVTSIQISISEDKEHFFMTNIENLIFPGFLAVYNIENIEGEEDDEEGENKNIQVPKIGEELKTNNIIGIQEYARPPGRYNEASLIDKLDPKNLNIGRPATYASIISKILEREYVKVVDIPGVEKDSLTLTWNGTDNEIIEEAEKVILGKEKNKFTPTHLGTLVTNFLLHYFPKIMDYKFTSGMEDKLDDIANGDLVWNEVLKEFYDEFHPLVMNNWAKKAEVEDKYTKLLGCDPKTGNEIYATMAKFGPVVKQIPKIGKPKYAPIKEPLLLESVTFNDAIKLFEFPKLLGKYEKNKVLLNKGEYGFYITMGSFKFSVDKENITLNEVIELIKSKQKKALAQFESDSKIFLVLEGPYGKYINVSDNKTKKKYNISLPKDEDVKNLTLVKIQSIISSFYKIKDNKSNKENKDVTIQQNKEKSNDEVLSEKKNVNHKKLIKKAAKKAENKKIIMD